MKRIVQWVALLLVLGALGYWVATGANRGWTKTSVPIKTLDEVTGIEGVHYEKRFVPGLDFLACAAAASVALTVLSLFFRNKRAGTASQTEIQDTHT